MMQSPQLVSVVIPVFNESKNIAEMFERTAKSLRENCFTDYEIIFVNDGSTDESLSVLRNLAGEHKNFFFLTLSRQFGHQNAIIAGLNYAKGKHVVVIDGDLQDPPEIIPQLLKKAETGCDIVFAKRTKRHGESFFKRASAYFFYRLLNYLTDFPLHNDVGDFFLISRRALQHLIASNLFNPYLRGQIARLGFKQGFVLYERDARKGGKSSYSFFKMLNFAFNGLIRFNTKIPKILVLLGLTVFTVAIVCISFATFSFTEKEFCAIYIFIAAACLTCVSTQLILAGLILEYLTRAFHASGSEPNFIVEESN